VAAAIHVTPEAADGGALGLVEDGDIIRVDGEGGWLEARVTPEIWAARQPALPDFAASAEGMGRELFAHMRRAVSGAELGASIFFDGFDLESRP
jgi:phosphogluconate dehydratase